MCEGNGSAVTQFFILGFKNLENFKISLFFMFLLIYILILLGNLFIITLVSASHHLNVPMYLFLRNLSVADILFTTNIMPNMLYVIVTGGGDISITGCFIQYYVFCSSTFTQSLILTVMAFDRYVAICHPLRYAPIMSHKLCQHLIFWPWAICFVLFPIEVASLFQLTFCGSNIIEHFFCDYSPILVIASSDTSTVQTEDFIFSISLTLVPFVVITISYFCIVFSILKITSIAGRWKAFSTCSAHLTTIFIFYVTQITIYIFPVGEDTFYAKTVKSLLYTVLTPFINPIIYSMRNHEIKRALQQLIYRKSKTTTHPRFP
ncbi:olfactory receptor-like protein COR4 [Dendropsophus ebraccatus]|uniref:olfactory receptor-like protein COR4 n=1 Tax=Dendropsophus ebraccatus TaxID=150705 RepID=UPI003831BE51